MLAQAKRFIKTIGFRAHVRYQGISQRQSRPCVVVFPSNQPWDPASNLRAWLMAPALRQRGWRVVVVPAPLTLRHRQLIVAREQPDVIFIQQTRHPLNRPHLYSPIPCVLDADDADYVDERYQDMIAQAADDAAAVIGGSRFVAGCLGRHNASSHVIWTCTPWKSNLPAPDPMDRSPIVAWAHGDPLAYPHEAALVRSVMTQVGSRSMCSFWMFGTHESREVAEWFRPLRLAGVTCTAIPPLRYPQYLATVSKAAIGLQPVCAENPFSQGKSFGKVLAYLSGAVTVVASNSVDHPLFFADGHNGRVLPEDAATWADAIVELLENPQKRAEMGMAGHMDFRRRLTMEVFARKLDGVLTKAIER